MTPSDQTLTDRPTDPHAKATPEVPPEVPAAVMDNLDVVVVDDDDDDDPATTGWVMTAALTGMTATPVRVEASNQPGLPGIRIIGLPDSAVREAADRISSAMKHHRIKVPKRKFVVHLAPASLRKQGGGFDLPLALAMLVACKHLEPDEVQDVWAYGELGLDGTVRGVPGTLPVATAARAAGAHRLLVPPVVAREAALVPDIDVIAVSTLAEAMAVLKGTRAATRIQTATPTDRRHVPDLADVRGQVVARRALEIAAAGDHHLLLVGPPGCGKSMLARRLPGLLPPLDLDHALRNAAVRSVAGLRRGDEPLDLTPPFRDPHHSTSAAGLIGGGSGIPRPGELSLAHGGVLFLDELLETPRHVLDALREPLETGEVALVRAAGTIRYPARIQLVAATNPCPCGMLGSREHACRCRSDQIDRYRSRLSGPLLDRLDVHVELPAVPHEQLIGQPNGEPTEVVAARVRAARALMVQRWGTANRHIAPDRLREVTAPAAQQRLARAVQTLGLSARAYDRTLRVARTIADLAGDDTVTEVHVDEAVGLRITLDPA